MALATNQLPFGLRDVRITPLNDDGSLGTPQDLPAAQTFTFTEAEDYEELRGDDGIIAVRGKGPSITWALEAGGISLDAWKVFSGGTLTTTGTTPNQVKTYKKNYLDVRPYFKAEGQAISDSGGDMHGVVFKARASDNLEGEMADGTFWVSKAGGKGLPNNNGDLYEFVQNESITAIP